MIESGPSARTRTPTRQVSQFFHAGDAEILLPEIADLQGATDKASHLLILV
jgi:hypothetical protein